MRSFRRFVLRLPLTLVALLLQCHWLASLTVSLVGCDRAPVNSGPSQPAELTRELLDESLAVGRQFLVNIQRPEGNFYYQLNLLDGQVSEEDNEVRQAGTLWSVATAHLDDPREDTREAVIRGLEFFDSNSKTTESDRKYIAYPDTNIGKTGTVALVTLALIEFLRAEPDHSDSADYRQSLAAYVEQLLYQRRDDGRFHGRYYTRTGKHTGDPSPYYDGETLLALSKAANYMGRADLEPIILESAEAMFQAYFATPLQNGNNELPKQFYQWGSMAFLEIYQTTWDGSQQYAGRAIEMADWLLSQWEGRPSTYNSGYAYEGIISAWQLARLSGDAVAEAKLRRQIDQGMLEMTAWQVGGPMPNEYLRENPPADERAVGGCMRSASDPLLRIDVTQHQMHAVILARRYVYPR